MKKLFKYTWAVIALSALTACSDDTTGGSANNTATDIDVNNGKELIAFSQEGSAMTRASFTRTGFDGATKVMIRIKAEEKDGTGVRYTQAVATAQAQTTVDDDCNTKFGLVGTHSHLNYASGQERFWDDAFGRKSQLTVYAVAVPNKTDAPQITDGMLNQTGQTAVSTATNPNWFTITSDEQTNISWQVSAKQTSETRGNEDLAYSNNIKDGETTNKGRYHQAWSTSATPNDWVKSMELGRMIWQSKDPTDATVTTGKFDQGHLVFKHALSWITIVFKEGEGFNYTSTTDFIWTNKGDNAQAVALKGFPTSGKFDISKGTWSEMTTNVDVTQMQETEGNYIVTETPSAVTGKTRTLDCYVLPGTTLHEVSTNVLEFEIDNAQYKVKGSQIANAIRDYYKTGGDHASELHADEYRTFTATQAGKHYVINLTVGKKKIDNITAAILDWETVNSSDATPDNTYCSFSFENRNTRIEEETNAGEFSIYRAAKTTTGDAYILNADVQPNYAWETGYNATAATKEWVAGTPNGHWKTNWFWENNQTYYHFRAIGEVTTNNVVSFTTDTNGDYFGITSGEISGSSYKDYIWGAPFTANSGAKFKYDNTGTTPTGFAKNGDAYQISRAIGATDDQIKMLLFHMTSQIYVNVRTTDNSINDAVVLCNTQNTPETTDDVNATTVEILNFLPDGKVLMGNGLVTATDGTRTANVTMTAGTYYPAAGTEPNKTEGFSYGIVPQKLTGAWGTIGLRITTPDGNQYVVKDLSACKGSVSETNLANPYSGSTSAYSITEWFPHYRYTYTITLKKTGIQNITAAVLPWDTVTGDLGTIDLEN